MAIICKLRAYQVKESKDPSVLRNLALILAVSIIAGGAVLGIGIMTEPTAKAAGKTHHAAPAAQEARTVASGVEG